MSVDSFGNRATTQGSSSTESATVKKFVIFSVCFSFGNYMIIKISWAVSWAKSFNLNLKH